jgi:hypothetical protein
MATAHAGYPGLGSARISPLTLIGLAIGTAGLEHQLRKGVRHR